MPLTNTLLLIYRGALARTRRNRKKRVLAKHRCGCESVVTVSKTHLNDCLLIAATFDCTECTVNTLKTLG